MDTALIPYALWIALILAGLAADLVLWRRFRRRPPDWRAAADFVAQRTWRDARGGRVLAIVALCMVTTGVSLGIGQRFYGVSPSQTCLLSVFLHATVMQVVGFSAIASVLTEARRSWKEAFGFAFCDLGRDTRNALLFYLAAMPFVGASTWLWDWTLTAVGIPLSPQDNVALLSDARYALGTRLTLVGIAILLAPILEELLFRGIALPLAAGRRGLAASVIAVSLFFSLLHFHLPSVAPLFVIAVAFSLGYVLTRSIAVPIFMHALFNLGNILLLFSARAFGE